MSHDHNPDVDEVQSSPRERRMPPNPREDLSTHGRPVREEPRTPAVDGEPVVEPARD